MKTVTIPKFLVEELLEFKEEELNQERERAFGRPTRQLKIIMISDEIEFIKFLLKEEE